MPRKKIRSGPTSMRWQLRRPYGDGRASATHKATLNPASSLRRGATYSAVVTTGAKDLSDNNLDQNTDLVGRQQKVWFFILRAPLQQRGSRPSGACFAFSMAGP